MNTNMHLTKDILPGEEKKKKQNTAADPLVKDYSNLIRDEYAAAEKSALAGLEAGFRNSIAELDRQEAALPGTYNAARNQAAGSAARAQRNFDVAAAASGLGAGTGAQARLAQGVTLQNKLGELDRAQADALADLGLQRTKTGNEYNSAVAKEQAENARALAGKLYEEGVRVEENTAERERDWRDFAFEQEKYRDQQEQQDWENAFAREQYEDKKTQQSWDNDFDIRVQQNKEEQQDWQNAFAREEYEDKKEQQEWDNAFDEQVHRDNQANTDRELSLDEREYEDERADKAKEEKGDTTRAKNIITGIVNSGDSSMAHKVIEAYAKNIGLTDAEVRYLMNYFGTPG